MSSSEAENTDKDEHKLTSQKLKLKSVDELKTLQPEILFEYVETLHGIVKKQDKKLRRYKNKFNKLRKEIENLKDVSSKDDFLARTEEKLEYSEEKQHPREENKFSATEAFDFVDEMRQAAQEAQNISNFIYEPTSGLYYDQKSGYYYNAEYGLYYDGNNGCYYNYNTEKNCYEFHSQVQVQPTTSTAKGDDDGDMNSDEEIVFDEFGVVTDREKLRRIREEKEQQKQEKESKFKKKLWKENERVEKNKSSGEMHNKCKISKKRSKPNGRGLDSENVDMEQKKFRGDIEEGELSSSSTSSSNANKSDSEDEMRKIPIFKNSGRFQDIAKKYPPSVRLVVQETNLDDLKVGTLSLITFKGGSLGREGNHDVIIPDVNVSKFHLKFTYDTKRAIYKCVDLGSRNGTILNGVRMSASKTESKSYDLVHGSVIQISQTKLLCHIHEGNSTCGLCEPGLLIETQQRDTSTTSTVVLSHKEQLKKIQRKYGLENEKFVDSNQNTGSGNGNTNVISSKNNNYQDRAARRRLKVGSSSDKEKTQIASVDTAISSDNKGFKMLSKLGWNRGETLGKTKDSGGLLEPINVESNTGYKGLGCNDPLAGISLNATEKRKIELMKKTKERYKQSDIFSNTNDSN